MLAPVRSGGGMRMKVLESMARGKAVVTTGLGAEGFNVFGEELPFEVADSSPEIAAATARLLDDDRARRELGGRARDFAERHHSPRCLGGPAGGRLRGSARHHERQSDVPAAGYLDPPTRNGYRIVNAQPPYALSVIIPSYNRRELLRRCLDSLAVQTQDAASFEVVVVDDGSTDGTAEMVAELHTPYRLQLVRGKQQRWARRPQRRRGGCRGQGLPARRRRHRLLAAHGRRPHRRPARR